MASQPARKCRCASETHGHKPGECTNLATLPELSLCKPCYDKSLEELEDLDPERGKEDERKEGRKHRRAQGPSAIGRLVCGTQLPLPGLSLVENVEMGQLRP